MRRLFRTLCFDGDGREPRRRQPRRAQRRGGRLLRRARDALRRERARSSPDGPDERVARFSRQQTRRSFAHELADGGDRRGEGLVPLLRRGVPAVVYEKHRRRVGGIERVRLGIFRGRRDRRMGIQSRAAADAAVVAPRRGSVRRQSRNHGDVHAFVPRRRRARANLEDEREEHAERRVAPGGGRQRRAARREHVRQRVHAAVPHVRPRSVDAGGGERLERAQQKRVERIGTSPFAIAETIAKACVAYVLRASGEDVARVPHRVHGAERRARVVRLTRVRRQQRHDARQRERDGAVPSAVSRLLVSRRAERQKRQRVRDDERRGGPAGDDDGGVVFTAPFTFSLFVCFCLSLNTGLTGLPLRAERTREILSQDLKVAGAERVERRRPARGGRQQIPAFADQRGYRLDRLEARGKVSRARLRARERRQDPGGVQRSVIEAFFFSGGDRLERADDGAFEVRARAARDFGRLRRRLERVAEVRLQCAPGGCRGGRARRRVERLAAHAKQNGVHETRERAQVRTNWHGARIRGDVRRLRRRNRLKSPGELFELARARAARRLERVRALIVAQRGGGRHQRRRGREQRVHGGVVGVCLGRRHRSRRVTVRGRRRRLARERSTRLDEPRRLQHHEPPAEPQTAVGGDQALRRVQQRAERVRAFAFVVALSLRFKSKPIRIRHRERAEARQAGVRGFPGARRRRRARQRLVRAAELQRRGFARDASERGAQARLQGDPRALHHQTHVCFIRLVLQKHALVRERLEAGARRRNAVQREEHGVRDVPRLVRVLGLAELGSIPRGVRGVPERGSDAQRHGIVRVCHLARVAVSKSVVAVAAGNRHARFGDARQNVRHLAEGVGRVSGSHPVAPRVSQQLGVARDGPQHVQRRASAPRRHLAFQARRERAQEHEPLGGERIDEIGLVFVFVIRRGRFRSSREFDGFARIRRARVFLLRIASESRRTQEREERRLGTRRLGARVGDALGALGDAIACPRATAGEWVPSARRGEPKKRARASRRRAALGDERRGVPPPRASARRRHRVRKRLRDQRRAQAGFDRRHAERAAHGLEPPNGVPRARLDQKRARQRVEREPGRQPVGVAGGGVAGGGVAQLAEHVERDASFGRDERLTTVFGGLNGTSSRPPENVVVPVVLLRVVVSERRRRERAFARAERGGFGGDDAPARALVRFPERARVRGREDAKARRQDAPRDALVAKTRVQLEHLQQSLRFARGDGVEALVVVLRLIRLVRAQRVRQRAQIVARQNRADRHESLRASQAGERDVGARRRARRERRAQRRRRRRHRRLLLGRFRRDGGSRAKPRERVFRGIAHVRVQRPGPAREEPAEHPALDARSLQGKRPQVRLEETQRVVRLSHRARRARHAVRGEA